MGNAASALDRELLGELERNADFIALRKRARRMQIEVIIQEQNQPIYSSSKIPRNQLLIERPVSYESIPGIVNRAEAALSAKSIDHGYMEFGYQSSPQ